jgi:hypothetical protein
VPPQAAGLAGGRRPLDKLGLEWFPLAMEVTLGSGEPLGLASHSDWPHRKNHRQDGDDGNPSHGDKQEQVGHDR